MSALKTATNGLPGPTQGRCRDQRRRLRFDDSVREGRHADDSNYQRELDLLGHFERKTPD